MIIVQYAHRLPADYDISLMRSRAKARGHLFDAIPELYFKAFVLRERGRFGATQNEYGAVYLWRKDEGFRDFLVDGRTRSITDTFGRPQIETRWSIVLGNNSFGLDGDAGLLRNPGAGSDPGLQPTFGDELGVGLGDRVARDAQVGGQRA